MSIILFMAYWFAILLIGYGLISFVLFLNDKGQDQNKGDQLKIELLYTMCQLDLIPYWMNPKTKVQFDKWILPHRKIKSYNRTWFGM